MISVRAFFAVSHMHAINTLRDQGFTVFHKDVHLMEEVPLEFPVSKRKAKEYCAMLNKVAA